jgi:hypothetical protein
MMQMAAHLDRAGAVLDRCSEPPGVRPLEGTDHQSSLDRDHAEFDAVQH